MPKTKRELDREINEILETQAARSGLSRHHRYLLSQRKPGGALGAGYLTPAGWHGDPLTIEDPKLRLAALREQPAPKLPRARQHSSIAREHTAPNAADLKIGQRFDHFGHIYEIIKIGRDKDRTVQIARRVPDAFGKEAFIDHRAFPARHFDQQHLRPIPSHATIKAFDAPKPELTVRQINAIVRAADGRNVYLIRQRLDEETIQRVIRARTRGRETEVRSLATGNWLPVLPERGDRLEVR
jgi:hypothetical protein